MSTWPDKLAFVIDEAAHAASASRRTLEKEMAAGRLKFHIAGGRRRIFPQDLRRWLAGESS
jgi:excisionase family DNA binding protein